MLVTPVTVAAPMEIGVPSAAVDKSTSVIVGFAFPIDTETLPFLSA